MNVDILAQIGVAVPVGLAAENAVLVVEFAKQAEERGETPAEAATEAALTRLRPILMTSFAFILVVGRLTIRLSAGRPHDR